MYKPDKPVKYIYEYKEVVFPFKNNYSSSALINDFNKWCKKIIPPYSKNKLMSLTEHYTGVADIFEIKITVSFHAKIKNINYLKEVTRYQKKLTKWKKLAANKRLKY